MARSRRRVLQVSCDGERHWRSDELSVEEPLEIRVDGVAMSVTMRTPGADFELAAGFLLSEGVIADAGDIVGMRMCPDAAGASGEYNVVEVKLRARHAEPQPRAMHMTSSCGICGKASIETVRTRSLFEVRSDPVVVTAEVLSRLPNTLRDAQQVFSRTGGLHAAGLFDAGGTLRCVREDVGRHNAFDKVIGWALTNRLVPLTGQVMLVSGRASFELVQKACMAGVPVLAAVSAPSDLAVELAAEAGMTLVGFLRGERMNVYTGQERVSAPSAAAAAG
jgi:FdhD protein